MIEKTDTLIVGAGPIGLEVAAALKREGLGYVQVDAGCVGHTMTWWAPGTRFFSSPERIAIAGVPLVTTNQEKATREEYLAYLRGVARQFDLAVRTFERVEAIEPAPPPERFLVRTCTACGTQRGYAVRNVVLAIGDMHGPRLLGVPGEDLPHVSHYLRDPHEYFGLGVLIVGGRNSAVEAAIRLYRVGASVSVCLRAGGLDAKRIKYWLLPEIEGLVRERKIGWHPSSEVVGIEPGRVAVRPVGGSEVSIDAQSVLLLTGYVQDPTIFRACGIELLGEQRSPRHDRATMQTNIPGLFVAGTATAGTQSRFRVFIETCHQHAGRIAAAIAGRPPHPAAADETAETAPET